MPGRRLTGGAAAVVAVLLLVAVQVHSVAVPQRPLENAGVTPTFLHAGRQRGPGAPPRGSAVREDVTQANGGTAQRSGRGGASVRGGAASGRQLAPASVPSGNVLNVPLRMLGYHFVVDLLLGSVPAPVAVVVDTGSSDLVVLDDDYDWEASTTAALMTAHANAHVLVVDRVQVIFTDPDTVVDYATFAAWPTATSGAPITSASVLVAKDLIVQDLPPRIHSLRNTSGFLGLSYGRYATGPNSTFMGLVDSWFASHPSAPRYVGLDFDAGGDTTEPRAAGSPEAAAAANGTLQIGGLKPEFSASVQWSEAPAVAPAHSYTRPIFHLEMCGVRLFANYSSNWPVLVDTGAVCLSLPPEFYEAVMAWLPSRCDFAMKINGRCRVGNDFTPIDYKRLPHITFRLSESGPPVAIPVSSLIVGSGVDATYCILSTSPHTAARGIASLDTSRSRVVFGTLVVSALYTVIDMEEDRLGFAPKPALLYEGTTEGTRELCQAQVTCVGGQIYYAPKNMCIDPDCDAYFFQDIDPATHTCITPTGYKILGTVMVLVFVGAEVVLYATQAKVGVAAAEQTGRGAPQPPISRWSNINPLRMLSSGSGMRRRQRLPSQ